MEVEGGGAGAAAAAASPAPLARAQSSSSALLSPSPLSATRLHFLGDAGGVADEQMATDISRSSAFSLEQLAVVVSSVLDCLKSPAVGGVTQP